MYWTPGSGREAGCFGSVRSTTCPPARSRRRPCRRAATASERAWESAASKATAQARRPRVAAEDLALVAGRGVEVARRRRGRGPRPGRRRACRAGSSGVAEPDPAVVGDRPPARAAPCRRPRRVSCRQVSTLAERRRRRRSRTARPRRAARRARPAGDVGSSEPSRGIESPCDRRASAVDGRDSARLGDAVASASAIGRRSLQREARRP